MTRSSIIVLTALLLPCVVSIRVGEHAEDLHGGTSQESSWPWSSSKEAPPFRPIEMKMVVGPLSSMPPQPCGSTLKATAFLRPPNFLEMQQNTDKYLVTRSDKYGKACMTAKCITTKVRVVATTHWKELLGIREWPATVFPIRAGQEILQVGNRKIDHVTKVIDVMQSIAQEFRAAGDKAIPVTFSAGTDARGCWGDTIDLHGRGVCSQEVFTDLLRDMASKEAGFDKVGKSGSTIVTNFANFIIKNIKDLEEYEMTQGFLPAIGQAMAEPRRNHEFSGCYKTGLAPICGILQDPGADVDATKWLIMRKIEIPPDKGGHKPWIPEVRGMPVEFLDIKGPKFAGMHDGKSNLVGDLKTWGHKDMGFNAIFPQGIYLRQCGSRDAARALEMDAELLEEHEMTDYSMLLKMYDAGAADGRMQATCACNQDPRPKFPLIFHDNSGKLIAAGVVDYIERKINGLDEMFGISMSTMKDPESYKDYWMRMWPKYFHLPDRTFQVNRYVRGTATVILINEGKDQSGISPSELLEVGDPVVLLAKTKFTGRTSPCEFDPELECLNEQTEGSGSKYKWYSGASGKIVGIGHNYVNSARIGVTFDEGQPEGVVSMLRPDEVMGVPRKASIWAW